MTHALLLVVGAVLVLLAPLVVHQVNRHLADLLPIR